MILKLLAKLGLYYENSVSNTGWWEEHDFCRQPCRAEPSLLVVNLLSVAQYECCIVTGDQC